MTKTGCINFNPIQDGEGRGGEVGQKGPLTSFSPVTSTNVKLIPNLSEL